VGHDSLESLYDLELAKTDRKEVSLMFGGIGDARDLHCTLLEIFQSESSPDLKNHRIIQKSTGKLFHFTIVDIKLAAIARDLVVFLMLDEIANYHGDPEGLEKSKLLPCLYYTYLSPITPRGVYDVL